MLTKSIKMINPQNNVFRACFFFCFIVALSFGFTASNCHAQGEAANSLSKTVNLLLNEETFETITIFDLNGVPLQNNNNITISIDEPEIVELRELNGDESKSFAESNLATDENGRVSFFIKGVKHGTATVSFNVLPNGAGTDTSNLRRLDSLSVNVIGIDAVFSVTKDIDSAIPEKLPLDFISGAAPFELKFLDESIPAGDEDDGNIKIKSRKWTFRDINNSDNPDIENDPGAEFTKKFNKGMHTATLEITAETDIGVLVDKASVSICATEAAKDEGFGSINGVVFNADPFFPLADATVTLSGIQTRTKITTGNGTFKFRAVRAGEYSIFACFPNAACENKKVIVEAETALNVDFTLSAVGNN